VLPVRRYVTATGGLLRNDVLGYHATWTCKMGADPTAAVNQRPRMHSLHKLRVIDTCVKPTVTLTNTNAPTIMIAENGAAIAGVRQLERDPRKGAAATSSRGRRMRRTSALFMPVRDYGTLGSNAGRWPMRAFLSHSSADKPFVEAVARELGRQFCAFDQNEFETGEDFRNAIRKALDTSDLFVLFASKTSKDRN
jgi:hypothetical protein